MMDDLGEMKTHPSFGFIRASRVSGHRTLFDSAIKHQHYVEVEIGEAKQARSFYQNQVYGGLRGTCITIAMSEAQFAQFITSLNVGFGAPCTITYREGKQVEPPPADTETVQTFEKEIREKLAGMVGSANQQIATVEGLIKSGKPVSKKDLNSIKEALFFLAQNLNSNLGFAQRQFAETIEKVVTRAKIDIEAHATMVAMKTGLDALQAMTPQVPELEHHESSARD